MNHPLARIGGLTVLLGGLLWAGPGCGSPAAGKVERVAPDTIAFHAVVTGGRFERRVLGMPGYHYIVWGDGRAAPAALFGFRMRFGGHRANIHKWHSGCIVCLYSCPGSKVGNARYTVRDYVRETTRFRVRPGVLPPDGTGVTVLLRLTAE
jgi:hypothetical protein